MAGYVSTIAQLLAHQNDATAQATAANGRLRGQSISALAQMPQRIGQANQQAAAQALQQRMQESNLATAGLQRKNAESEMAARDSDQSAQEQARVLAAHTAQVGQWLTTVASATDPAEQQALYSQGREALLQAGVFDKSDAPQQFSPAWVKGRLMTTLSAAEKFKQLYPEQKPPEPFTLSPGQQRFGADGTPIAGVDAKPEAPARPIALGEGAVLVDPTTGKTIAQGKPKTYAPQSGSGDGDEAEAIADAIIRGEQSPETTGLYKVGPQVRAQLAKKGYNQAQAITDWKATQKHLATLNGAQQTRMSQAVDNAAHSLDVIDTLADQWNGGKFPALNKARLAVAKQGGLGPDAQKIATALDAQISDVTSELGNVYMGGNSPTDHALTLAAKNLSADWSADTLKTMTKQARTNLQIRQNSMRNVGVAGASAGNQYAPPQATTAAAGVVKMQAPDGSVAMVPADHVEAAKAKGAKVVK